MDLIESHNAATSISKSACSYDVLDYVSSGVVILRMPSYDKLLPEFGNLSQYEMLRISRTAQGPDTSFCEEAELESSYFSDAFSGVHPDDLPFVMESYKKGYDTDQFTVKAYRLLRGDGSYIWVTVTLKLYGITPDYKIFMATYTDITESVSLQQKLQDQLKKEQELTRKAVEANQAKTRFLSNVSHDMRTPLNAIIGFTDLALEGTDSAARETYLDHIKTSGKFLLELINDTLELSKIENGKMTLHPEVISCSDMIKRVIVSVQPSLKEKNITLMLDNARAVMADIRVDILRVQEIFLNLLSNSIKYTPEGGRIEMVIECVKLEEHCVHDRIIIRDNGVGIDSAYLPHIFEPFTQEDVQKGANMTGTGLGLSIVKKLIDLMNGRIEVKSEKGNGTEFTVYLDFERICEPLVHIPGQPAPLELLSGKTILLCEDHPLNRELETVILEQKGMHVISAENGKEGVALFAASSPGSFDAILMDIRMPVMDGIEASKAIRSLDREDARCVPIIAITADAYEEDRKHTEEAGMNGHLSKPIDSVILYHTLISLFQ